jgi:hypothetical protein
MYASGSRWRRIVCPKARRNCGLKSISGWHLSVPSNGITTTLGCSSFQICDVRKDVENWTPCVFKLDVKVFTRSGSVGRAVILGGYPKVGLTETKNVFGHCSATSSEVTFIELVYPYIVCMLQSSENLPSSLLYCLVEACANVKGQCRN